MLTFVSAGFAFLIGATALWTGIKQLRNRAVLRRWPTTPGKVIERGTYQPYIATATQSAFRYAPLIRYNYEVNRQTFTNESIHPKRMQQPRHGTKKWAQAQADSFPEAVLVHYNPQDPGEAFLNETSRLLLFGLIAAALFAFLFGVMLLVTR